MPTRLTTRPLALLAGFVVSACTFILVPDVDDDGVARCEIDSDCPPLDDTRYVAICVPGTDVPKGTPNICSSDYDEVFCGGYDSAHPLTDMLLLAVTHPELYPPCSESNIGARGCGPGPDGCAPGLVLNLYGSCDDPEAEHPAVGLDQTEPDEIIGRDVQDQFCRSFFCDEQFVCDTR